MSNATAGRIEGSGADSSDDELVLSLREGSMRALALLFERYQSEVRRLALHITGSAEEAEDVVQDVFVGLRRALARYEERGRFESWLRKLASRTALMRVRKRRGRRNVSLDALSRIGDEGEVAAVVDRLVVQAAVAVMPAGQRRVFLLHEVEGFHHSEIAELLEISPTTSRVRLHRAWKFLEKRVRTGR